MTITETATQHESDHLSNSVDLRRILRDDRFDRGTRLLRLQGWRGDDLGLAVRAGAAHRLAPATCGGLSLLVAATGSFALLVGIWATALIGVFARNHPIELVYNRLAAAKSRTAIPRNRAAKRLGCAIGTSVLGASGGAFLLDQPSTARVIAGVMGVVAVFVATTNVCVPSILFTLFWGSERATARSLRAAFSSTPMRPTSVDTSSVHLVSKAPRGWSEDTNTQ